MRNFIYVLNTLLFFAIQTISAQPLSIIETGNSATLGEMTILLGMSIQEPQRQDQLGQTIDSSSLSSQWMVAPRESIRFPAGTDSYDLTSWNEAKMQYFFNVFMPKYPSSIHNDQTWPPQIPTADYINWVTAQTRKICLGNEPPNHTPSVWADGAAYVTWAKSVYDYYPALQNQMWIQSGKPEVIRYNLASSNGILNHKSHLSADSTAVVLGWLPPRIITTHKLSDQYPVSDKLLMYDTLVNDYKDIFGDNVQICFQEYKLAGAEQISMKAILLVAEFQLVMSRLRYIYGNTINGGTFQQGFAAGNHNYMGLESSSNQIWVKTAFTDLWDRFGNVFISGKYKETIVQNRPAKLQIELFEIPTGTVYLYCNFDTVDIPFNLTNVVNFEFVDNVDSIKTEEYNNLIPAMSAGLIYTSSNLSASTFENTNQLSVFPNPTDGKLIFKVNSQSYFIEIYDSKGNQIITLKNKKEFDISNYPNGVYYFLFKFNESIQVRKVIKK